MSYRQLLDQRVKINNLITAIEQEADATLRAGGEAKGFELKKGRKVRKVADEHTMLLAMDKKFSLPRDQFYTRKLIGIPAIETILKARLADKDKVAAFLSDHIVVSFSAPSLTYVGE